MQQCSVHLVQKKKAAAKKRSINTYIFLTYLYYTHTCIYSQGQIVYSLYIYFAVLCASAPNSPAFNSQSSFGGWLCLHWTALNLQKPLLLLSVGSNLPDLTPRDPPARSPQSKAVTHSSRRLVQTYRSSKEKGRKNHLFLEF